MKILLIDVGNARAKLALDIDGAIGETHFTESGDDPQAAVTALVAGLPEDIDAVAISNVAGREVEAALNAAFAAMPRATVWYAHSSAAAGGVQNSYARPGQLGVDRWAAIVGGFARLSAAETGNCVCVVDAGTAITIDGVRADGAHTGGLILPGLQLQRRALLDSTADIAERSGLAADTADDPAIFATDTATAIARSATIAVAAAIDRCVSELANDDNTPLLLLTGGDAAVIAPWLATRPEICPNLVFEGLALLFEQRNMR